ncbi:MAG: chloride channel protein [Deltaproteobacteria bacterium]|nr:chloride channel protein [Deltaproteobacteria bacterium]
MRIFQSWRYPANWTIFRLDDRLLLILAAIIVGSCSGLASVILNRALMAMFNWFHHLRHYWWVFVLPATGAALSSLFLEKVVKEGAGHGVPEVIYSVSRYGGLLRFRSSFSRLISSALTIGSGGSAGPEAPVVISGAAIGSNIAKYFSLNDRQRVTLVGCGAAGAISSIFNAPIAGMVFAIEVIIGEWKSVNIVPIAIASVMGTEISRILQGNQIAFSHRLFNISHMDILACVGLAILTAAASILLTRLLRSMDKTAKKVPAPLWIRAAIGGCAVGLIGLFLPEVLGKGYHVVQTMIEGDFSQGLIIVGLATLAKIVATALTLGWGGSGGIFAPCLVIGSLAGLTYHHGLVLLWPSVTWVNQGCFALLGMAGLISGMLQAPLTGIFLIVEITGGYEVILPLIIVSAVTYGHLLRPGTDARVLSDLNISELIEKDCIAVTQNMLLRDFIKIVKKSHRNYFPVEDEETGHFMGIIHLDDIRQYLFNPVMYDTVFLSQIMNTRVEVVNPDDDLADVIRKMDANHLFSMPVVVNNRFIGLISKGNLLDQYRKELMVQTCQSI